MNFSDPYDAASGRQEAEREFSQEREQLKLQAAMFARAADTERAEAKFWREYAEKLEAAIRECETCDNGCLGYRALREKAR